MGVCIRLHDVNLLVTGFSQGTFLFTSTIFGNALVVFHFVPSLEVPSIDTNVA